MKKLALLMSIPFILISQPSVAEIEHSKANKMETVPICEQNDTSGVCLGIYETNLGTYFSATPSVALLTSLGYQVDDSAHNEGNTYAQVFNEDAPDGIVVGEFAGFRQDGHKWVDDPADANYGENGQYDRYCKTLGELNVGGRSYWRRISLGDLQLLQARYDLLNSFGWAVERMYWSKDNTSEKFYAGMLYSRKQSTLSPSVPNYASCVAPPL
ncbi:hypothetical protein JFQ93_000862 [Aeromonas sobria]|nr:hypothetical protein [Aeromonas sobria]